MKALCASFFIIAATSLTLHGEDLLSRAKELVGDMPPYKLDKENKGNVRETKYPGERYTHTLQTDVTGTGRGVVKRKIWFDTEKRVHFHHTGHTVIAEEILSSDEELKNGKIKSRFTVLRFSEKIGSAKSAITLGSVKSEDIILLLRQAGRKYHKILKITSESLIAGGLKGLLVSLIPGPQQAAAVPVSITALPTGILIHYIDWFLYKKLPKITDQDGFYTLNDKEVKAKFPEYEKIVMKIRNLEGSVIDAEWEFDKGYTRIELNAPSEITNSDKKLLAKMIYRMNPICARTILPANLKDTNWSIDAGEIGGMVLGTGIDYDSLKGKIHLHNRGKGAMSCADEMVLGRPSVPTLQIDLDPYWDNKIYFSKKWKDKSKLNVGLIPTKGNLTMVVTGGKKKAPVYIKELTIYGKFDSSLRKEPDSLLTIVEFDEANLTMKCSYVQLRERPNQTINEMKQEIRKYGKQ